MVRNTQENNTTQYLMGTAKRKHIQTRRAKDELQKFFNAEIETDITTRTHKIHRVISSDNQYVTSRERTV